ncbi:rhodanese-like domain-containing protein, partial [Flavobacteriaceae bacterium]|nr:rhodanese-like domain-containing protein [Flavobacteriaceae bacterium]
IMPLSDDVIVYPAHGAGSACGKNMMKETVDTLGNQKKVNYALRDDMTKEEFIKEITEGLLPPPDYFPKNVKLNKEGYRSIDEVIDSGLKELSPFDFEKITNQEGALMLDVRKSHEYAESHIPNSIFIGLDGSFAPWAGELIVDLDQPIVLICPDDREEEAITRLSRLGFDNTKGFLKGGLNAWTNYGNEIDSVFSISPDDFKDIYIKKENKIFDVRKKSEFLSQHINNAYNTPLSEINSYLSEYPKTEKFYVHCAGGYRSMIASSILKSRGFHNLVDIKGGYKAIEKTSVSRSEYICPSLI